MMSSPGVEEGGTLLGSSCITPSLSIVSNYLNYLHYLTIYTAPVEHHGPRRADEVVRDAGQPPGGVGQPVVRPGQGALVQTLARCGHLYTVQRYESCTQDTSFTSGHTNFVSSVWSCPFRQPWALPCTEERMCYLM